MPPPYGQGNWFHSRSSSSEGERDAIVTLVKRSKTPQYSGLRWSGDKTLPLNVQFANEIGVNAATMQTKIRAFIRFGFLIDKHICPLEWSILGEIWRKTLTDEDRRIRNRATKLEQLIIASSLAFYSFDDRTYQINPVGNYRPLHDLFNHLDANGFISQEDLENLIGKDRRPSNWTYWMKDFTRGDILRETLGGYELTNAFPTLFEAIKTVNLPNNLNDTQWQQIHDDVLHQNNPYRDVIIKEMEQILEGVLDFEDELSETQKDLVTEMISSTNALEQKEIDEGNFKIEDTYSKIKTRRKQSAWSKRVREIYEYTCCVPECDVNTSEFTTASHIKGYSSPETGTGHRANPRNGLCLCPLCHQLFDKGYFTLTEDHKIEISPRLNDIESTRIKDVLVESNGKQINPKPPDGLLPDIEFINYHRQHKFLSE